MTTNINQIELRVFSAVCQVIGQATKLDHALESVLRILSESLEVQRAKIVLADEQANPVMKCFPEDAGRTVGRGEEADKSEEAVLFVKRTGKPFVISSIDGELHPVSKLKSVPLKKQNVSWAGVPIFLHGSVIGLFAVDRVFHGRVPIEEDLRFLSILANLIAQIAGLNRQLRKREEMLRRESSVIQAGTIEDDIRSLMASTSPAVQDVLEQIRKVAPSKAPILLIGESGTGKSLLARTIHELSSRARFVFLKLNCALLSPNLLERELFGYEKGAFPGASRTKPGQLEEADQGTIFLDEIVGLPLPAQAKLGRYLQDQEFERSGGTRKRMVDVRIVASTTGDPADALAGGTFSKDLYYSLNMFAIFVPSLRERRADIPFLVHYFLEKACAEYGRKLRLVHQTMDALSNYDWPGNVRELKNLIERLVLMAEGNEIKPRDLPVVMRSVRISRDDRSPLSRLEEIERKEVVAALERNRWIQSQTARELGLTMRQINYRVKKFGLDSLIEQHRSRRARLRRSR